MSGLDSMPARRQARVMHAADRDARHRHSFKAWRIAPGSRQHLRLDIGTCGTVEEAVAAATVEHFVAHKETLAILHHDSVTGQSFVHFFAIKQKSQPVYRKHSDGTTRAVRPLYSAPLFTMAVHDFDPVEPWKWEPGCDVVGARPKVIEQ